MQVAEKCRARLAPLGRKEVHGSVMLSGGEGSVVDTVVEGALERTPGAGKG
jgi:hypothetical protein